MVLLTNRSSRFSFHSAWIIRLHCSSWSQTINQAVAMNLRWREQGQAGPLLCGAYRKVLWNSQRTEHMEVSCPKSLILASEVSTSLSSCHSSCLGFPLSNNQEVTSDMGPHLSDCFMFGTSPLIIRGTHTRTWRGSLELVHSSTSKVMT